MQKRECRKQNPQSLKRNQPEKKSADFQKLLYQESAELVIIATEFFLCHVCRISGEHTGRCRDPAGVVAAGRSKGAGWAKIYP